ncbi:MAG: ferredoxin family protein [Caulobacteraceae bacterium]|nr:ferredoxin family protein [Caulobacteraceae bacterium]
MIELILDERCIGCNACVSACPTHVFDVGPDRTPVIARPDQCQTCFMCELYCEADAIYVGPDQAVREFVDAATVAASGQLGRLRRDYGWAGGGDPAPLGDFWRLGPLLRQGAEIAAERYERRAQAATSAE